jgi:hypothetical protein
MKKINNFQHRQSQKMIPDFFRTEEVCAFTPVEEIERTVVDK